MKRLLTAALVGVAAVSMATPAAAHTQEVTPPGKDPVAGGRLRSTLYGVRTLVPLCVSREFTTWATNARGGARRLIL